MIKNLLNGDRVRAEQSARAVAIICAFIAMGTDIGWYLISDRSLWEWHVAVVILLAVVGISIYRKFESSAAYTGIFMVSVSCLIIASAITNVEIARAPGNFVPLAGYKITAIIIAAFPPSPFVIAYASIAIIGLLCTFQYVLMVQYMHSVFPAQEPWMSFLAFGVSFMFMHFRIRGFELEKKLSGAMEEAKYLKQLATVFMALKDLTNTPLQTIEATRYLLEQSKISNDEAAKHLKQTLAEMKVLEQLLDQYTSQVDLENVASSFDAVATIKKTVKQSLKINS